MKININKKIIILLKRFGLNKPIKYYLNIIIAIIGVALGVYLNWSFANIIAFGVVIYYLLNPFPSIYLINGFIFCLIMALFSLGIHRQERAEEIAVLSFFLLVMIIIAKYSELKAKKK